ncbi:MAG: GntR family transcriptional regulator [Lacticaseibacillus paracasei]|nr:GntR family transcriptional regulator [Lacticaseibacillus paracasei]
MQLTIDFDSKIPLYTQIRDAIVSGIATGDLTNGTILPSIRALGNELGVYLHTVKKPYKEQQREGLVEIQRGRGVVVHAHGSPNQAVAEVLRPALEKVVAEAVARHLDRDALHTMIDELYDDLKE